MGKMVTRTVVGTRATVKVINVITDEVTTMDIMLSKTFNDDEIVKVKRAAQKLIKALDSDVEVVHVLSFSKTEKLYGVEESAFMSMAIELNPETRKPLLSVDTSVGA